MKKICETNECTACGACVNKCPVNAIYMKEDDLEREVAVIDHQKCIDCNLCIRVCPNNQDIDFHTPLKCIAMRTKDEGIKEVCSSGGIATTLGKYIVANEGVYFGAKGFPVYIRACVNEKEVLECAGSKYTESYTNDSYAEVRKYILSGKKVLYIGTPCQCSGLLSYIGEDNKNLITVDLVCHGVPPRSYFQNYVHNIKATSISFRNKEKFQIEVKKDKKTVWSSDSYWDPYYKLFMKGIIFRENCYKCKYAQKERVADFTIGDFWGLNEESLVNQYDGNISLCFVNTNKGMRFFEEIKDMFIYEEREIREAICGNEQLNFPYKINIELRAKFESDTKKKGSKYAVEHSEFGKVARKRKLKMKIKQLLHIQ